MPDDEKPSPRAVLSKNMRALMAAHEHLSTIKKVAAASASKLSNGKVGRICAASHTTDIDTLQDLADVFGLQPWQLLVEGLDPKALPRLADASVLHQILDAVSHSAIAAVPAHQLESKVPVGPALQKATDTRGLGRGSNKPGGVPKPGSRRRAK